MILEGVPASKVLGLVSLEQVHVMHEDDDDILSFGSPKTWTTQAKLR